MKDEERIYRIMEKLEAAWLAYPDLRLCQLLYHVLQKGPVDLFYVEDSELESALKAISPAVQEVN